MLCDIARLDGIINTKNDEEALVLAVRLLTKQVEFNMHCQELQDLLDMLAEGNEHAFEKAKERLFVSTIKTENGRMMPLVAEKDCHLEYNEAVDEGHCKRCRCRSLFPIFALEDIKIHFWQRQIFSTFLFDSISCFSLHNRRL